MLGSTIGLVYRTQLRNGRNQTDSNPIQAGTHTGRVKGKLNGFADSPGFPALSNFPDTAIGSIPLILLLDNQDSFVHNLARYFRRLGLETMVVRSNSIGIDECRKLNPQAVVISPGPRRPEDAGCCLDVLRQFDPQIPMLGVCLGHQAIAVAFGGQVIQCDPMHGMASQIKHDGQGVFANCPESMTVGRYHSLAVDPNMLPDELIVTATDVDGLIMGVRHRTRPVFGVQFHPESILSTEGEQVVKNFAAITSSSFSRVAS